MTLGAYAPFLIGEFDMGSRHMVDANDMPRFLEYIKKEFNGCEVVEMSVTMANGRFGMDYAKMIDDIDWNSVEELDIRSFG